MHGQKRPCAPAASAASAAASAYWCEVVMGKLRNTNRMRSPSRACAAWMIGWALPQYGHW